MRKKFILIYLILGLFLISGCSYLEEKITNKDININYYTYKTITNSIGNKIDLKLKIISSKKLNGKYPAIIMIPAGSFDNEKYTNYDNYLKEAGTKKYIGIEVKTRTLKQANYNLTLLIKDTKSAIKYIKNNANKFNINSNKIIVIGDGSGGYLALMGGLTSNYYNYNLKLGFKNSEVSVNLIGEWYSQTNFLKNSKNLIKTKNLNEKILNCKMNTYFNNCQNENIKLSPIFYITPSSPPIIIFQGMTDIKVSPQQSEDLVRKLRKNIKYKTKLVRYKGVGGNFLQSKSEIDLIANKKSWKELYLFINRNLEN